MIQEFSGRYAQGLIWGNQKEIMTYAERTPEHRL
ncbi:hypothetical protein HNQ58_002524 [Rehaibacterium terrae]|jgi:hypothetical protein|uniref:Uncharacterized protein n=1 Tax=Rehaibacterium terrae TaxID=1341696 RepID=A0A7W7Y2F6_9GAMM|nr:hypothetical protein [Rehaibacterium terrae]